MTEQDALKELEAMSDNDFSKFFKSLPSRTQLLIGGGLANWREVLPKWYIIRYKTPKTD